MITLPMPSACKQGPKTHLFAVNYRDWLNIRGITR
jgi:hypothetical protein